jgi:hypothetical protein
VLNGRGLAHRKLDRDQLAELACDVVSGQRPFVPSYEQACDLFNVPRPVLREHLKARREFAAQHPEVVVENGNGGGVGVARAVAALQACTPAERVSVGREFGVNRLWDEVLLPALVEDKAVAS